jgi:mannose-6-phosphate isomerase-like protein (cupin superfamily)
MMRNHWKHVALSISVVATFAIVNRPILGAPTGEQRRGGGRGEAAPPENVPLYLPDHHYDLPATHITAAQIQAHKLKMLADKKDDVPINMVKIGGAGDKHQAGISLVYRLQGQSNQFAVHDDVAEVYHVLQGSGTMLLGGKLKDARRRPTSAGNGMGISGTESEGAQEMNIAQGDVLIIPAGTPHKFKMANEFTVYTVTRIDPDAVTPILK